ncbi:ScpA family protein [Kangiella marina]|uniref:Segregation and condensation protein A n=1 Tax=Kangiella marina TaxID=1079178 RepID=A0ABP8INN8_9GAMM
MTEQNGESQEQVKTTEQEQHPSADHVQEEMPFALVDGEQVEDFPQDLYIPPDALEVFLEAFEGPLDLLLYLIKRQNVDIRDIPIAHITEQYMEYVELMKALHLELAAEYLVMAAMLAEIKSRVLLPRPPSNEEEEDDPRADLIRRLQEYEQFKQAAEDIDELPRMGRDTYQVSAKKPDMNIIKPEPEVEMKELLLALRDVLKRAEMFSSHQVKFEALSVRERMGKVLDRISAQTFTDFAKLFDPEEGRAGVVVTFLAIMELAKESLLEIIQSDNYGPIHVRAKTSGSLEGEEDIEDVLAEVETTSDQA